MATAQKNETKSTTAPVEKVKKEPVPAGKRISDQLKRAAVTGKITKDELENVAKLANSLVTFIS
jgi:hypothetical protein